jgi:hypothetical protein
MDRHFTSILLSRLQNPLPFIQVVIGPRQVGKTTGVKAIGKLVDGAFLYHSADLPSPPTTDWLLEKWQEARSHSGKVVLVFDEIQKIARWSEVVKRLFDEDRHRPDFSVVVLGSSSLLMQDGLSESLLGRFELIKVHHWTLSEHQSVFGWNLEKYLMCGGYPAPALAIDDLSRWQALMRDSIIEPMISKDILSLRQVGKVALLRQTMSLALSHPSQEISFTKILGQLTDAGNTVTIKSYLELLESAFLIRLLYKYSSRPITLRTSSPKILPLAPSLTHAYQSPTKIVDASWFGRLFEAAIGAHLLHATDTLHYWRDGKDEVDFVASKGDEVFGIEVKSSLSSTSLRTRGPEKFRITFPKAKMVFLTRESGEAFLKLPAEEDLWGFLKSMV